MTTPTPICRDDPFSPEAVRKADALVGALIRHIERFEPAGEPESWMTTIGHGPAKLPLRSLAAADG